MPLVACPNCQSESEVDAADLGFKVECPSCHRVFSAKSNDVPPPPPPKATLEPTGPKEVICQHCDGAISVNEEDLGHPIECPLCSKVFVARGAGSSYVGASKYDDDDYRPRRKRRRSRYRDDDEDDDDPVGHAIREVNASAVGIIVCGWISVVICVVRLVFVVFAIGVLMPGGPGGFGAGGGAGVGSEIQLVIAIVSNIMGVFYGGFAIFAGSQMRKAKNYGLSMTICIISLVPVLNPCCILGLIFGIMGLVKLNETRVKKGFQMNRPGFDPDMG